MQPRRILEVPIPDGVDPKGDDLELLKAVFQALTALRVSQGRDWLAKVKRARERRLDGPLGPRLAGRGQARARSTRRRRERRSTRRSAASPRWSPPSSPGTCPERRGAAGGAGRYGSGEAGEVIRTASSRVPAPRSRSTSSRLAFTCSARLVPARTDETWGLRYRNCSARAVSFRPSPPTRSSSAVVVTLSLSFRLARCGMTRLVSRP